MSNVCVLPYVEYRTNPVQWIRSNLYVYVEFSGLKEWELLVMSNVCHSVYVEYRTNPTQQMRMAG